MDLCHIQVNFKRTLLCAITILSFEGCTDNKSETKETFKVTNRIPKDQNGNPMPGAMNTYDQGQCNSAGQYPLDNPTSQTVRGKPIAGVDNTTFQSGNNGIATDICGKCATITGSVNGQTVSTEVIIVDRIHQQAGKNNLQNDASKPGVPGPTPTEWGQSQIDVSGAVFDEGGAFQDVNGNMDMNVEIKGPC